MDTNPTKQRQQFYRDYASGPAAERPDVRQRHATMEELPCPRCRTALYPQRVPGGSAWSCPNCKGAVFNLALLRTQLDSETVSALWEASDAAITAPRKTCPSCTASMSKCSISELELEVCRRCQLVWFDPGEAEALGVNNNPPLTAEARRAVSLAQSEALAEGASIQRHIAAIRFFLLGLHQHLGKRE
jgi:Zn-finger nucleic acid-binding protein